MSLRTDLTEDERDLLASLLARADKDPKTSCREWSRGKTTAGYGVVTFEEKPVYVHRLIAMLVLGLVAASGLCVLHRCDNPSCINPEHLFLGTQGDNMKDAARKGRKANKLSPENVIEIKRDLQQGKTHKALATRFAVSRTTISHIAHGKTWSHIIVPDVRAA